MHISQPKRIHLTILCLIIFVLSIVCLFYRYPDMTDTAYLGGDTWAYQSAGVNLALGHGYKTGGMEKFETYKFTSNTIDKQYLKSEELYDRFINNTDYFFYTTPGYPFVLAFIYKLFGIHPLYVKIVQILLISVISALLVFIGYSYWKLKGIVAGVASSVLFLLLFSPDPELIMTEPLIIFALTVWVIFFILWEHPQNMLNTVLVGLFTGIFLLIKGYILLPWLFIAYSPFILKSAKRTLFAASIYLISLSATIAPSEDSAVTLKGQKL